MKLPKFSFLLTNIYSQLFHDYPVFASFLETSHYEAAFLKILIFQKHHTKAHVLYFLNV